MKKLQEPQESIINETFMICRLLYLSQPEKVFFSAASKVKSMAPFNSVSKKVLNSRKTRTSKL